VEVANSVAVDASNQAWIAGRTASQAFPSPQGWSQGSDFVTGFDATGSKLIYSARYPNDAASQSVAVDGAGMLHVAGPTGFVSTVAPASRPLTRIFGVANAAAGPLDARVAGGEVISIYGPHIGPATPVSAIPDSSGKLPAAIAGYQVVVSEATFLLGEALPLLYVSDSQINAVVPFGLAPNATFAIGSPSGTTPGFEVSVVSARPEIFQNSDGAAIAINQDGTLNSTNNPAAQGSYVSIWVTGAAPVMAGSAGQIATAANDYRCCAVEIGNQMASVSYAGAAPGAAAGVTQINFQIPSSMATGGSVGRVTAQVIAADGSISHAAAISVR
jgi:uncharacterized protein (TIGR03437 family)